MPERKRRHFGWGGWPRYAPHPKPLSLRSCGFDLPALGEVIEADAPPPRPPRPPRESCYFGTASKAMVVRALAEWNGTVPCHI
jgi:hypothetical protein